jgi:hypothetical protein
MSDRHASRNFSDNRRHRDSYSRVKVERKPSIGDRIGCASSHLLQLSTIAKGKGSRHRVHKAQSAEPNLMLEDEGGTCVEADERGASDKRIVCKALVNQGIANDENVVAKYGEIAEREVAGSASTVDSKLCFEYLKIDPQQGDNRGFDLKMLCGFRTQTVELWHH